MAAVPYIVVALVAYLLGSIPTGFLVAKSRGVDIRQVGSGNIGATNVFRYLGKPAGVFVLLADAFKGFAAVAWLPGLVRPGTDPHTHEWLEIVAGISVVLGHTYTCWLYFRGGKGIATSAGVLIALVPWSFAVGFSVWLIVLALSRYVSLASIGAALSIPPTTWLTGKGWELIVLTSLMAVVAIYKHKANIQRLLKGTENRFGSKPASPPSNAPSTP